MLAAMRSLGLRQTKELLEGLGVRPKTGLGQHFITDPNTVRRIVDISEVGPGDQVLEVGPGLGALSRALLDAGVSLIAIERDTVMAPALEEVLEGAPIVWGDAMVADYVDLLGGRPTSMVANLPYQIATPLIVDLLVGQPCITDYTIMVQKEVGLRFAAKPGDAGYGGVSVKIAALADAKVAMRISKRVFYPMPDVESVIVRIKRLPAPRVDVDIAHLFAVIEAGFGQRRKTVRNALRSRWSEDEVATALTTAGVDPGARAETLGIEPFAAIAAVLP